MSRTSASEKRKKKIKEASISHDANGNDHLPSLLLMNRGAVNYGLAAEKETAPCEETRAGAQKPVQIRVAVPIQAKRKKETTAPNCA